MVYSNKSHRALAWLTPQVVIATFLRWRRAVNPTEKQAQLPSQGSEDLFIKDFLENTKVSKAKKNPNQNKNPTTLENAKRNTHQGQGKLSSHQIVNNAKNELWLEGSDSSLTFQAFHRRQVV